MIDFDKMIVDYRKESETSDKLADKLFEIWNNPEFVALAMHHMRTEEQRKKLLGYILDHNVTSASDVVEISLCIEEGSEPDWK